MATIGHDRLPRTKDESLDLFLREAGVFNNSASTSFADEAGVDGRWNFEAFKKRLDVRIVSLDSSETEFDLIGVDASIANAIRRVLLSEVPTIAIEKVMIYQNSSIIQDEVLAHRLGLVPLSADTKMLQSKRPKPQGPDETQDWYKNEDDTLEFELKVKCTMNPHATKDMTDPNELYRNSVVTTADIKWVPIGNQVEFVKEEEVLPFHKDIVLAKLRPGHEIDCRLLAWKGIGRDHAKFMPATVFYRLLPKVEFAKIRDEDGIMREVEVTGDSAYKLQKCFSPGVIKIEENPEGEPIAKIGDARYDTCSRNVFLHEDLKDKVVLSKKLDHFIFTVESIGAHKPDALVCEAIKIMMQKCTNFLKYL